ncbi:MAG: hypothetical protein ACKVW3_01790 [Phycisphaerales bacterium]
MVKYKSESRGEIEVGTMHDMHLIRAAARLRRLHDADPTNEHGKGIDGDDLKALQEMERLIEERGLNRDA